MIEPQQLKTGHCYFCITYPDASLTKPIIGTYEFVAKEVLESDGETAYLFRYHPKYRSEGPDTLENGFLAYSEQQLEGLYSIESVQLQLEKIREARENGDA